MSFRERPEYKVWRDAVLQRFGQSCIACGHTGNIHVHHILPVATYPELAFDPDNGAPLCGNCHAQVTGEEMAHVDQLRELQQRALGVDQESPLTIDVLRQAAEAAPSDSVAVAKFLNHLDDSREAVRFHTKHQNAIRTTTEVAFLMAYHLHRSGNHLQAIKLADCALKLAFEGGGHKAREVVDSLALWKAHSLKALGKTDELVPYLGAFVAEFSDHAFLHWLISQMIAETLPNRGSPDCEYPEECVTHALRAASLAPKDSPYLGWACWVCANNGALTEAMKFAQAELRHARDELETIEALHNKATVYEMSDLYGDALAVNREILSIDSENAAAMAHMAHCLFMEGKVKGAADMARRCLLYDADNRSAKSTLSNCERINAI